MWRTMPSMPRLAGSKSNGERTCMRSLQNSLGHCADCRISLQTSELESQQFRARVSDIYEYSTAKHSQRSWVSMECSKQRGASGEHKEIASPTRFWDADSTDWPSTLESRAQPMFRRGSVTNCSNKGSSVRLRKLKVKRRRNSEKKF